MSTTTRERFFEQRWGARSWRIEDPGPLSRLLRPTTPFAALLTPYHGVITQGEALRHEAATFADAAEWWSRVVDRLEQESDLPGHPTTGPMAFLVMDEHCGPDGPVTVIVPAELLVREHMPDGSTMAWRTWISSGNPGDPAVVREEPPKRPQHVTVVDDGLDAFRERAAAASDALAAGDLRKLLVGREVTVRAQAPIDLRWLVRELERTCPGIAIFCVDGLIGASPQVLLQRNRGMVRTQVLSGSVASDGEKLPTRLADMLRPGSPSFLRHRDSSDVTVAHLAQHALARPFPSGPTLRRLPGVTHLKTDITTVVADDADTLELLARLHPAVDTVGLPYDAARNWLGRHENLERGRFAAPVGWIDGFGNATFAIALRCGQLLDDGISMRLFSDVAIIPEIDVDEAVHLSDIKLRVMLGALGIDDPA